MDQFAKRYVSYYSPDTFNGYKLISNVDADVIVGYWIYVAVFAVMTISAIVLGAVQRKVIYVLPGVVAVLNLVSVLLGYVSISQVADEVMVMLLLTLNVLWHEIVLRPKSSFKARRGWLIAGIILLFINTVLVVITPAGVFINMLSCFVGLVCVLVGMGKAKEPRVVLSKKSRTDEWERIRGLGTMLAVTWFVMLLKTIYECISIFIEVVAFAVVIRYTVGFLLAAVAVILVNIPQFVAAIDPEDYDIDEDAERSDIDIPYGKPA